MRTIFTQFLKSSVVVLFLMLSGMASAATYTAVSSGLWTSASTWQGGLAPGTSLGALDQVIINEGVTVTLDTDVQFSGLLSTLEVNGTLETGTGSEYILDIDNANLSGDGELNLYGIRFGTTGTMTFTGDAEVNYLWNSGVTLTLASDLQLNNDLYLDEGTLNIGSGSSLEMMSGSMIHVDAGTMTISSGVFSADNYSVEYTGTDKTTGAELFGSGLTDVTLELDNNSQSVSLSNDVEIEGTLHHNTGMLNLNGNELSLMGDYQSLAGALFRGSSTSSLDIQSANSLSNELLFHSDYDELENLSIYHSNASGQTNLGSDLMIHNRLTLGDGDLLIAGTLGMQTNGEIWVQDGRLMLDGGEFDGTNAYRVSYHGSASLQSGVELTGEGLHDLDIDMPASSDSVRIMNNISLDGELNLDNGGMAMNGYDLTLNGSLSTASGGWLSGNDASDMTFNTTSLAADTLWFSNGGNVFGDITINAADNSDLMIGSDLHAENVNMTTGGMHIWDNELWLNSTGSINGANENRYVVIDGSGSLVMNIQVSSPYTMYHVGTDEGYSPVGLQQNSGTAGYFKVNTFNGVWSEGDSGDNFALNDRVVNRTWDIQSVNGGAIDMNMVAMWNEDMEMNIFDRMNAYMMQYTEGEGWDMNDQTGSEATMVGDMYRIERQDITSPGRFAVRDAFDLGVEEQALHADLYPNPIQDQLTIAVALDGPTTFDIVDVKGNVLHTENVNATGAVIHTVDFSAYPKGVYIVNCTNATATGAYRVVKQ